MTKKRQKKDPHADREAKKYQNPVASREFLLELLDSGDGPLTHRQVCRALNLDHDDDIEAVRRRLIAMVRDGQLIANRKGAFARVDKMDLVRGFVLAHKEGYGFLSPIDGGDDLYLANRQMRKVFDGDEVLARKGHTNFRGQSEASIVEVLKHNTRQVVGRFVADAGHYYLRPDNPKIHHDIFIEDEDCLGAKNGQIILAEILRQPGKNQYPRGKVIEVLGDHLAPGMEIDVAIRSHGVPHEWPSEVLVQAEAIEPEVNDSDKGNRIDLRALPFVTIDGEDARDFDDAVYCSKSPSGGWVLYVAIADVSHYVQPDSPLDCEAQVRGNSVYFPDFVVPMLPEALSNGLCSLNPKVDRLCMVCEMTISVEGKVSAYTFYESVIFSQARLTYTKVAQMLDVRSEEGKKLREEYAHVASDVDSLFELYTSLHAQRAQRGAIEFETTETRILFDDQRKIQQIVPVQRNDAHRLIEECMLAANVCAARFLEQHEIPGLYRVHEPPKAEKLEVLGAFLAGLGMSMPKRAETLPSDYQAVLAQAQGRPDAHLIQTVMLRSMNQAVYRPENHGHFGLAYSAYTHFTSPIRRYPDLLVHRALRYVIRSKRVTQNVKRHESAVLLNQREIYPYTEALMESFGDTCSRTERRADDATRDVESWLKCEYLLERVGEEFDGLVSSVTGFGLFVELKDLYVEGLVHITNLPQDYYQYDPAKLCLLGERTGQSFHLGDELRVRVVRVSLEERKIDFEIVSVQGRAAPAKKKSKKPARNVRKRVLNEAETNLKDAKKKNKKPKSSNQKELNKKDDPKVKSSKSRSRKRAKPKESSKPESGLRVSESNSKKADKVTLVSKIKAIFTSKKAR